MFTKECLRTAFEKLSKVDKWDNYCVKGGRWIDDRPVFDSHEDMINTLVNDEKLLTFINSKSLSCLPCFEITSDSDIGQLINLEHESAGGQYSIKGYITKDKVFELGRTICSFTSNYIDIFEEYVTYITENGGVLICNEWTYRQHMTDVIDKVLLQYRTINTKRISRYCVDCSVLEKFFAEFKNVWVN